SEGKWHSPPTYAFSVGMMGAHDIPDVCRRTWCRFILSLRIDRCKRIVRSESGKCMRDAGICSSWLSSHPPCPNCSRSTLGNPIPLKRGIEREADWFYVSTEACGIRLLVAG